MILLLIAAGPQTGNHDNTLMRYLPPAKLNMERHGTSMH
jgi:hypothetical protein